MVISIFNQKGGVGKTTTTINLSYALAEHGKKVLIMDLDPQANASLCTALKNMNVNLTSVLNDTQYSLKDALYTVGKVDVIPSVLELADIEVLLGNEYGREFFIKNLIEEVNLNNEYDYIIIDCSPNLGLLNINALTASDRIIVPIFPDTLSTEGLNSLSKIVSKLKERGINKNLDYMGILFTRVDNRSNQHKGVIESYKRSESNFKIFDTFIRANIKLQEANDNQESIITYDVNSNGYSDYMNLAKEVLNYGK